MVCCCWLPDPFRGIGDMAEDHGAPEAVQLPKVWTRGRTETESHQRVCSWTVQNEMRNVLGRVPQALQKGFSILPILEK